MENNFLGTEENLVQVPDPVVFIGDLHGQYYDMMGMFDLVGRVGQLK